MEELDEHAGSRELDDFQTTEADFLGNKTTGAPQPASELEQAKEAVHVAVRQLVTSIVNHTLLWLAERSLSELREVAHAANETGPDSQ